MNIEEVELLTFEEIISIAFRGGGLYQDVNRPTTYLLVTSNADVFIDNQGTSYPSVNGAVWLSTEPHLTDRDTIQPLRGGEQPGKRCWKRCPNLKLHIALNSEAPTIIKD